MGHPNAFGKYWWFLDSYNKVIGPFSPIHFVSISIVWSVLEAIRSARNGNIELHKRMMKLLYLLTPLVTGFFTLIPGITMDSVFFWLFVT